MTSSHLNSLVDEDHRIFAVSLYQVSSVRPSLKEVDCLASRSTALCARSPMGAGIPMNSIVLLIKLRVERDVTRYSDEFDCSPDKVKSGEGIKMNSLND